MFLSSMVKIHYFGSFFFFHFDDSIYHLVREILHFVICGLFCNIQKFHQFKTQEFFAVLSISLFHAQSFKLLQPLQLFFFSYLLQFQVSIIFFPYFIKFIVFFFSQLSSSSSSFIFFSSSLVKLLGCFGLGRF